MKKSILILLVFYAVNYCQSQLSEDKALHFLGGNLYGLVGAGVADQISKGNRTWTFVGSLGGSLLIGLAKESIDKAQYDGWDNDDLLATVLGGATVGVTIDLFRQRKKRKRDAFYNQAIGNSFSNMWHNKPNKELNTSLPLLAISNGVLKRDL
ncbi:hypothetical protein ACOCEA_09935 [Maribacter sp. CXY002]|uniref:hypothetical protein n=1 Tax=Maribacter luteocoastalis TaxID=3407671 RepID=UPI003B6741B8